MKILIDQRVQENFYICNNNFVLSQYHLHLIHWHGLNCFCSFSGFPLQKGRHKFRNVPSWAENQCESITFDPFIFYPHKKIYVQLTVNHFNYSDPAIVHEATAPWVESVNTTQFTACVTRVGRNDYPSDSFADVDWVAYQGAPSGGVAGEEKFSRWWTELVVKQLPFQAYVKCCTEGL